MDYVFPIHNRLKSRVGEVGVAVAWCIRQQNESESPLDRSPQRGSEAEPLQ